MSYQRDTFYYPVTLEGGATDGRLYILEDTGGGAVACGVDLDAGRWYGHADPTLHAAGYLGLWYTLIDELNNDTGGDGTRIGTPTNTEYAAAVVAPSESEGYVNGGIELRAVNATNPFQISFSGSPKTTLDPRLLGNKDPAYGSAYNSVTDGADEVVIVPHGVFGRLVTQTLAPNGRARRKRSKRFKKGAHSAPLVRNAIRVIWEDGRTRPFAYESVQGGWVYAAEDEPGFQLKVGLAEGDMNAAWEHLWDSMTEGDEIIVVHNSTDDLLIATHAYEVGQLQSSDDWAAMFREKGDGADLYDVNFELWINPDFDEYSH